MTALPDALKAGIERAVEGLSRREIARRSEKLSEHYRGGGTSKALADPLDVAAYLLARMPATYAAISAALAQAASRVPDLTPRQVLDIGAGPGTASWAAVETWPALESVRLLDSNPALLAAARNLAAGSPHPALSSPHVLTRDLGSVALASADLVIAGYCLAEIPQASRDAALLSLWEACSGLLVIVEPGTPEGFERIRAARTTLLAHGAHIAAPCPHALACPIVAPDWCHFSQRLARSRDHMRVKSVALPFEDEKFSYLAVAREPVAPFTARVIGPVLRSKAGLALKLCEAGEIRRQDVPARNKPEFSRLRRVEWGDPI